MSASPPLPESRIEGVVVAPLACRGDERGWLAEIWRHDQVDYLPAMGYVSFTRGGVSRGPHEHRSQSDYFAFCWGRFRIQLWDDRPASGTRGARQTFEVGEHQPAIVVIPPGVVHAYTCLSEHGGLVINLPDRLYAGVGRREPVDEIRHEDDTHSAYGVER